MSNTIDGKTPHHEHADSLGETGRDNAKRTASGLKLEPQPSDEPIDPLNWPLWKMSRTLAILCFASFVGIAQATCNQGGFLLQAAVYHKTPIQVANSVSSAVAGLATAPFLGAWLSRRIGRTSVIFWAMLCNFGVNLWSASMIQSNQYVPFVVFAWKGHMIRQYSMERFRQDEGHEACFSDL